MEQHPVPRNISSFQFHLVGDMTLRQFLYLAGGAGLAFLIFKFSPLPGLLKWPLTGVFGLGGFAFAFLPIQERPLDKWLIAFIKSINSPTQYLWQKEAIIPDILARSYYAPVKKLPQSHQEAHQEAEKKLAAYISSIPKQPHQTLNIREKNYVDQTLNLFSTTGSVGFAGRTFPGTQMIQHVSYPQQTHADLPKGAMRPDKTISETQGRIIKADTNITAIKEEEKDKKKEGEKTPAKEEIKTAEPKKETVLEEKAELKEEKKTEIKTDKRQTEKPATETEAQKYKKLEVTKEIKTPTPIIAKPVNQEERKDVSAKATTGQQASPEPQKIIPETDKAVKEEKREEIKKEEEEKLQKITEEKKKLEKELNELKQKMKQTKKPDIVKPELEPEKKPPTIKTVTPRTAVNEIGIPRLPQTPNIIMGVVKDTSGKILPNIILTVKDTKGTPHRALKTNRLGQFSTATPLQNGVYYIEAEDPMNRYVFDIGEINLAGKVFLPIEITAKGKKEIMREKLNQEIFGSPAA